MLWRTVITVINPFSAILGKGEDNHTLVLHRFIQELKMHKESYTRLCIKKEKFDHISESLVPYSSGPESEAK